MKNPFRCFNNSPEVIRLVVTKFRDIKTLQKSSSIHASIHNHFNHDRHFNRRDIFKQKCSAA